MELSENLQNLFGFAKEVVTNPVEKIRDTILPEPKPFPTNVPDKSISEEEMKKLPFDTLAAMRDKYASDKEFQKKIAPHEHRAFSKMLVEHNPAFWTPALAVMTPGYQAYKLLSKEYELGDMTPPDLSQMLEGYKGIVQGLKKK